MYTLTFTKQHTDLLKVYFILTVTAFHILRAVYSFPIMPSYGVVGFFIISGYGCYLSLQSKSFISFIKSRLSFIVVPYYIALIFYIIAHFFFGFYNPNTPLVRDVWGIITHTLFIHNLTGYTQWTISGILWFIAPIMQLYFLSFWFKKFVDFNKYLAIITIILIFICAYLVKHYCHISNLYFYDGRHIIYIAPFLSGMILAKYHQFLLSFLSKAFSNLFIFFIYVIIILFITYKTIYSSDIMVITLVLLLSFPFLLYVCDILEKFISTQTITFLGLFSFFVYLYNYAFFVFSSALKFDSKFIKALVYFLVTLVVAYLFYLINTQITKLINKSKLKP